MQACLNLEKALREAGAELRQVVRTTLFAVDVRRHASVVATVHQETFGDVRPATTVVGVAGLYRPEMLVEIQADAFIPEAWFELQPDAP